ncbi:hypothetical protein, partial [Neisseria sp. HMSC056A03]|uniref:hypothetical protein n=1 Tax=Neisseria sp. HMSC056A03 TaxID=1739544 RepID=UPI001AEFA739
MAAPLTLPVNYAKLQSQRAGCVRYARTRVLVFKPLFQTFRQFQTWSENFWNKGRLKSSFQT